jgi:hypothetical protein
MSKKQKYNGPTFVMITDTVLDSEAWREMSHGARSLYIALKRRYWQNRKNNGKIFLSLRHAQKEIGSGLTQICRWYRELEFYGFIVMTRGGSLGLHGKGRAPHWRLTEVGYMRGSSSKGMEDMPTRDFLSWDGALFGKHYSPSGSARRKGPVDKIQNPDPENGSRVIQKTGTVPFQKTGALATITVPENGSIQRAKVIQKTGAYIVKPCGVARAGSKEAETVPAELAGAGSEQPPWTAPDLNEITDPVELEKVRAAFDCVSAGPVYWGAPRKQNRG